jgi:serine/threonine protein kinase
MGVVYKARQIGLDRIVALKMILAGPHCGREGLERFQREARAAAALDHPNLVPVHEYGHQDGQPFFTMAFIDGPNLCDLVRRGPVSADEAARLTRGAAEGVAYVHDRGILHRDLKPMNVLVDPQGRPRVTDFGLARHLSQPSQLTETGLVLGTPRYMAPEQARGQVLAVSTATDIYGLGTILYYLLTGRPPFCGDSAYVILHSLIEDPPLPPSDLNPDVPKDLEAICLRCLAKEPGQRYPFALALVHALDDWAAARAADAHEPSLPRPAPREAAAGTLVPEASRISAFEQEAVGVLSEKQPATLERSRRDLPWTPRRRLWPILAGLLAGIVVAGIIGFLLRSPRSPGDPPTLPSERTPAPEGQSADQALAIFPPPPLRRDFDVAVELFDYRDGQLIPSRFTWYGVRILSEGRCVLRITSSQRARIGIFSVNARARIYELLPNQFEPDHLFEANAPRELPAGKMRTDYQIALSPSTGIEQVRVLATTGAWPDLKGHKEGPFIAFREEELKALCTMRDMRIVPYGGFAEVMVPFVVEKANESDK